VAVKALDSVHRALTVLEIIAAHQPVGVSAVARLAGMTKSSTQRLLVSLDESRWICVSGTDRTTWVVAPHALSVAFTASSRIAFANQLMPALSALRDLDNETAFIAVPDGSRTVLIRVLESTRTVRVVIPVGTGANARESAGGLAIAAHLAADAGHQLLGGEEPEGPMADDLAAIRRRGFAMAFGAVRDNISTVAAPVFDAQGVPIAAIGVAAPTARMTRAQAMEVGAVAVQRVRACGLGEAPVAMQL
jgi:IclR family acetate operon transcriptional repressor